LRLPDDVSPRGHDALPRAACEMLQLTLVSRFEHSAELRGRLFRLRSIR
jgi:hypothetical protein